MTPDLQARIEAAARELAHKLNRNYARIIANNPDHVRPKAIIIESLTTLAEQIISEKDAEAAGMREAIRLRLQSVSLVLREGRQRQPGNQYVSDAVWHGWIHERKVLDELLEIELPTAGRDLLAERDSLRERVRELEGLLAEYSECWKPGVGIIATVKPGHGSCCTCQACGYPHDECVCRHNEIERRLKSLTTTEPSR